MSNGFIRVASATPKIKVGDCAYNAERICEILQSLEEKNVQLAVFPELCITGYTCSDLFWQSLMLKKAWEALKHISDFTKDKTICAVVGLPIEQDGKLYNVAAVVQQGKILGLVPKKNIPNYAEFYEARHFKEGFLQPIRIKRGQEEIPFGMNLLFICQELTDFTFAIEICEDIWVPSPPSILHAQAGANIILNLSASDETTGKDNYRRQLVEGQSGRLICAYVYSDAGEGESSTDFVFSAHNMIAENGIMLAEAVRFQNQTVYADIDLDRLRNERVKKGTFGQMHRDDYQCLPFHIDTERVATMELERNIPSAPFVPSNKEERDKRCEEILSIQAMGLKKRLEHTGAQSAVIGISGGLDSTLALLVTVRAFDALKKDRSQIVAVTMPGFGTTGRTYQNACQLIKQLGATLREISIQEAVSGHFKDIGHDPKIHDITYENAQARQRTLLLMDIANQTNGLVVGTGDMSELALGWATYNGDHMSMYGVNASVPKTLVRHLVRYYADTCKEEILSATLYDVLDTPVSPELLPPENGEISQKTEDLVGPYELHDFFLYYVLRMGFEPTKILYLAEHAFAGVYAKETIKEWLKVFYRRFFSQQFKRSCLPDGPKVGSVAVSPRGDLRMPSDACVREWLEELE